MKFLKKHWAKIISGMLMLILCVYVLVFALNKAKDYEIYKEPTIETKIYTLWHVETFEGGSVSRVEFLKAIARQIETENAGILIMIKPVAPEVLADELKTACPDMISFGFGVGKTILNKLQPLQSSYNVRDELVNAGKFNNTLYALPFMVSGYAMITHGSLTQNFHCGQNGYTKPENVFNNFNLTPAEQESQYEAYKDFVYDNSVTLLGTGRDVYRVNNLNKTGRASAIISPVDSYTDLVQFFGIVNSDEITNKFLSYTLSDQQQMSLNKYSLFSSKNYKIYTDELYSKMEDAISICEVKNVFD